MRSLPSSKTGIHAEPTSVAVILPKHIDPVSTMKCYNAAGVLSDPQQQTPLRWTRRCNPAQALALRAHILLACASGKSNTEVARGLH